MTTKKRTVDELKERGWVEAGPPKYFKNINGDTVVVVDNEVITQIISARKRVPKGNAPLVPRPPARILSEEEIHKIIQDQELKGTVEVKVLPNSKITAHRPLSFGVERVVGKIPKVSLRAYESTEGDGPIPKEFREIADYISRELGRVNLHYKGDELENLKANIAYNAVSAMLNMNPDNYPRNLLNSILSPLGRKFDEVSEWVRRDFNWHE